MQGLPSGLVTFMFTDIEGSTRLHQRLAERYATLIAEHDALLGGVIDRCGGVVVSSAGDGMFAAFPDASAAVAAAVGLQQAIGAHSWPDLVQVRVRVGLHCGLASPQGGDYVALAVHQAARVASAAQGGQVLVTAEVAASASAVPDGLSLAPLGRFRLKDFDDPVALFQLHLAGLAETFPAVRAVPAAAHNVPIPRTSFVGREREMTELAGLLVAHRLVSVVGPGGVGKTRLMIETVRRRTATYPDGVWVVLLAPVADPEVVTRRVADVLGVHDQPGRSLLDSVLADLAGKRLLLVMDNCEHLLGVVADVVNEVVDRAPGVRVLTTSREPLGVAGERVWRLGSLASPGASDGARGLAGSDAVRLFLDRAAEGGARIDLADPGVLTAVADICAAVDAMPLAIELAARRCAQLGLEQLHARIGDRLAILASGPRVGDPRQRTLRALIDWSFDLLGVRDQSVFRRLSVFRGPFSLAAAEAIAGDGQLVAAADVLDAVGSLVDKSLLTIADEGTELHYRMLVTLRDYATEKLAAAGEAADTANRHVAYWVSYLEPLPAGPRLTSSEERSRAIHVFAAYADDLRAALEHALAAYDPAPALALALRKGRVSFWRGTYPEGIDWLERCLQLPGGTDLLRGWAHFAAGLLLVCQLEERAMAHAQACYDCARASSSDLLLEWAIHLLADVHRMAGDLRAARDCYRRALASTTDRRHRVILRRDLGEMDVDDGDLAAAGTAFLASVEESRALGDEFETMRSLTRLGGCLARAGDPEAGVVLREAFLLACELDALAGKLLAIAGAVLYSSCFADHRGAIALHAAATRLATDSRESLAPYFEEVHREHLARSRAALTPADYEAAWAHGLVADPATLTVVREQLPAAE